MKTIFFSICFLINLLWIPPLYAADNTCWISTGLQEDVWVIVYDADGEGNRGDIIWKGKISENEKIKITSTDGHIRYKFKINPDEGYEGDISADCFQQNTILVD